MNHRIAAIALAVCAGMGVSACARLDDAGLLVFSSSLPAIVIVNGQVLQGDVQLLPNRKGVVSLALPVNPDPNAPPASSAGPISSCAGSLQFNATAAGSIDLRCNDGSTALLRFAMISDVKGYAYGQTATDPVSLAFGLRVQEARAYLTLPANRQLVERPDGLALEPK